VRLLIPWVAVGTHEDLKLWREMACSIMTELFDESRL